MEIILKKLEDLEVLMKRQINFNKEILTLEEAVHYLGLSKSTLYKLTSKREIPFYSPGGKKIYFKRSEILDWIIGSPIITKDKAILENENYVGRITKNSKL